MDYGPHFQTGHPSSFELARRVAQLTPEGLDHVFFCRSEEHTSELQSLMRISYAVFCLKKKKQSKQVKNKPKRNEKIKSEYNQLTENNNETHTQNHTEQQNKLVQNSK